MKARTIFSTLIFAMFFTVINGQITIKHPDEFLQKGEKMPEVLLVGSFHFAYYGADAHVTAEEDKVDILSPSVQKEVKDLVDYIARFKPTKIMVEGGRNSGYIMSRYRNYKKDKSTLKANEIDQICFRLMDQFGIDTLYGTDANGLISDMYRHKDSAAFHPFLNEMYKDWDFRNDSEMDKRYEEWYDYDDQLSNQIPLLDYFKYMNSDESIKRMHGAYLIGDFKLGEHRGADALAIHWYARNLRIFRNIQNVETSPDDRILVLYGAGHVSILKQLFESTPEYELIPFGSLENSVVQQAEK